MVDFGKHFAVCSRQQTVVQNLLKMFEKENCSAKMCDSALCLNFATLRTKITANLKF